MLITQCHVLSALTDNRELEDLTDLGICGDLALKVSSVRGVRKLELECVLASSAVTDIAATECVV